MVAERPDMTALGRVEWHSSEEDGGPDVGLSLGLGGGRSLWLGEMAVSTLAEHGIDVKETGDGWWWVMFGDRNTDTEIAARVVDSEAARKIFDRLEVIARKAATEPKAPASPSGGVG